MSEISSIDCCQKCQYFSNDKHLACAVNPITAQKVALQDINSCSDFRLDLHRRRLGARFIVASQDPSVCANSSDAMAYAILQNIDFCLVGWIDED